MNNPVRTQRALIAAIVALALVVPGLHAPRADQGVTIRSVTPAAA